MIAQFEASVKDISELEADRANALQAMLQSASISFPSSRPVLRQTEVLSDMRANLNQQKALTDCLEAIDQAPKDYIEAARWDESETKK